MSITNQQKQAYLDARRYFYAASPNYFGTPQKNTQKKEEDEKKRQKNLLNYLNQAKKSAIKRGMYNQKPYEKMIAEAKSNV